MAALEIVPVVILIFGLAVLVGGLFALADRRFVGRPGRPARREHTAPSRGQELRRAA